MKTISVILTILLTVSIANAVVVTCVNEGSNVVRIDYNAADENSLPIAFALNITADNGATIPEISDYKTGDSSAAEPGYGIFPRSIQIDKSGRLINWGYPDVNGTLGTSNLALEMACRYIGGENAPPVSGTLCRVRVNPNGAATVNVNITANNAAGGVVLENAKVANFTGIGVVLGEVIPQPPAAPASINYPSSSSTGQYTVSWPASTGASSYQIERSANNGSTWTAIYSGANVSYSENIVNGSYRYRVRASNSAGTSIWRTGTFNCVVSIPAPPAPPAVPASISYPSNSSTGKYTVSWASSSGATSYRLDRSNNNGSSWAQVYSGSNTSYSETVPNGSYRYRARASNTAGTSSWRTGSYNCVVSIPATNPPAAPASISYPTRSRTGEYTVSWPASSGASSYQLERSSNRGRSWTRIYSGSNTSFSQNLGSGSYRYRVRAVNSAGVSSWRTGTWDCRVYRRSGEYDNDSESYYRRD